MEFFVNNGQKIVLSQLNPDGPVKVITWGALHDDRRDINDEYTITPGDFVMMLNWYRHQKRTGNTDLNF